MAKKDEIKVRRKAQRCGGKIKTAQFPALIKSLPQVSLPVDGAKGYLFQGEGGQIVFLEFEKDVFFPLHSHASQWETVVSGEVDLKIGKKKKVLRRGDSIFIPEGVAHGGLIKAGYRSVVVFDSKDRYKVKDEA